MNRFEIQTADQLQQHLTQYGNLEHLVVHSVNLDQFVFPAHDVSCKDSVFLGCSGLQTSLLWFMRNGGLLYQNMDRYLFRTFRTRLYTADELFGSVGVEGSPAIPFDPLDEQFYDLHSYDKQIYLSCVEPLPADGPLKPKYKWKRQVAIEEFIARRLHDSTSEDCLQDYLVGKQVVAFMGGHDTERGSEAYRKIAILARSLSRLGFLIATGGGPGLMEAANLGAFFGHTKDEDLLAAISAMAVAPLYSNPGWLATAWTVRSSIAPELRGESLGVPTWYYGHEPPNVFGSAICKLFDNSLREEGLLALANHGLVVGEGNAGTVQEIFQDACQNYYRTIDFASPAVLIGVDYWNPRPAYRPRDPKRDNQKPVWPLLSQLAVEKNFRHLILLTDSLDEAKRFIVDFVPEKSV